MNRILSILIICIIGLLPTYADFDPQNPSDPDCKYKITTTANPAGSAHGGGYYFEGEEIRIEAYSQYGNYRFSHWTLNDQYYSDQVSFTYVVTNKNENFVAVYKYDPVNPNDPDSNQDNIDGQLLHLTFKDYNDTVIIDDYLLAGSRLPVPDAPHRVGYTFTGWSSELPDFMPPHDVCYTASYSINSYTINFDTEGGPAISPIMQEYDSEIVAPQYPTKEGYTFVGWNRTVPEKMPAENITIKATWQINTYNLVYKINGEEYTRFEVTYGDELIPLDEPTKKGYSFSGWSEIPLRMPAMDLDIEGTFTINKYKVLFLCDGDIIRASEQEYRSVITMPEDPFKTGYTFTGWNPNVDERVPDHDVLYTATFTVNSYTYTFNTDGGSPIEPIHSEYGLEIKSPDMPFKSGYIFGGWDKDIPHTMEAADMTFKAIWIPQHYKITYIVDGSVYKTEDVEYMTPITPIEGVYKEGYTFVGWQDIPENMPANDITLYAVYTINSYKVEFIVDNMVFKRDEQVFASSILPPSPPVKEGYTFVCWTPALDEIVPAHDVTYNAVFSINSYTIVFDSDGGSEVPSITANFGAEINLSTVPVRKGYTFMGWDREIPSKMGAENLTAKAIWQKNKHYLVYYVDGVEYNRTELEFDTPITPLPAIEKIGYTFSGWSTIPEQMPDSDVEIHASFSVNKYSVKFIVDDVCIINTDLDYGSTIIAPNNPTKLGYTFTGWYPEVASTVSAQDVVYTATFSVNSYTISFDTDGGSVIKPITADFESIINIPEPPFKDGYTFCGWNTEIPQVMPAESLTIKALWHINSYNLVYTVDGNEYKRYSLEYDTQITPLKPPTKKGYSFSGWSEIPSTMPSHDVEILGTFVVNKYKLTFKSEGEVIFVLEQNYNSAITSPPIPTKEGYKFVGWNIDIPEVMPAYNMTFNAIWEKAPLLGDANDDGTVDMADARLVIDYYIGKTNVTINLELADVNGDGKVTMADANMIVNIVLGK